MVARARLPARHRGVQFQSFKRSLSGRCAMNLSRYIWIIYLKSYVNRQQMILHLCAKQGGPDSTSHKAKSPWRLRTGGERKAHMEHVAIGHDVYKLGPYHCKHCSLSRWVFTPGSSRHRGEFEKITSQSVSTGSAKLDEQRTVVLRTRWRQGCGAARP